MRHLRSSLNETAAKTKSVLPRGGVPLVSPAAEAPHLLSHQALGSARFHVRKEFVSLPPDLIGEAVLR
jgi:hypothetical protein